MKQKTFTLLKKLDLYQILSHKTQMVSPVNSTNHLRKKQHQPYMTLSKYRRRILSDLSHETSTTLTPNPDKDIQRCGKEENCRPISLMQKHKETEHTQPRNSPNLQTKGEKTQDHFSRCRTCIWQHSMFLHGKKNKKTQNKIGNFLSLIKHIWKKEEKKNHLQLPPPLLVTDYAPALRGEQDEALTPVEQKAPASSGRQRRKEEGTKTGEKDVRPAVCRIWLLTYPAPRTLKSYHLARSRDTRLIYKNSSACLYDNSKQLEKEMFKITIYDSIQKT